MKDIANLIRLSQCMLIAILLLGSGCTTGRHLSPDYGASYRSCFQLQVINRNAPEDKTPVEGLPGYISTQIYNDRYVSDMTRTVRNRNGYTTGRARSRR